MFFFSVQNGEAARKHAKTLINHMRSYSNHTFYSALSKSRSDEERVAIVDKFYQMYEDAVAAAPADYGMDYVFVVMHIEKTAGHLTQ